MWQSAPVGTQAKQGKESWSALSDSCSGKQSRDPDHQEKIITCIHVTCMKTWCQLACCLLSHERLPKCCCKTMRTTWTTKVITFERPSQISLLQFQQKWFAHAAAQFHSHRWFGSWHTCYRASGKVPAPLTRLLLAMSRSLQGSWGVWSPSWIQKLHTSKNPSLDLQVLAFSWS